MSAVSARNIVKQFGAVSAVNGISLDVPNGEFMVLLGPSGCGKTTFLRIICGLEQQTSGEHQDGRRPSRATLRVRGAAKAEHHCVISRSR